MLKVQHVEAHRYEVESNSGQEPHLVDLEENGGKGECSCGRFIYKVQPKMNKNKPWIPCNHLLWARYAENLFNHKRVQE